MKARTTTPQTVVLERVLAAPIEAVWSAWTDPATIAIWISPNPDLDTVAECDLRPGGAWSVTMGRYGVRGEYVEVAAPNRVAFTWVFDHESDVPPSLVEVDLTGVDGGTLLRLTHSGHATEEDREGTREGWDLSLRRLGEHIDAGTS